MIIECPNCRAKLELPGEKLHEAVKCGSCCTRFVATEWSGVVLSENELAVYEVNHRIEKISTKVEGFIYSASQYAEGMLCNTMRLSNASFTVETAEIAVEDGMFESSAKYPHPGVYVVVRMEKAKWNGESGHSPAVQRFVEAILGYRVEKTYEDGCRAIGGGERKYVYYFVHDREPCQRTAMPGGDVSRTVHQSPPEAWRSALHLERQRTIDLIKGNEIERWYSSNFIDFEKDLRNRYKFGVIQIVLIDKEHSARMPVGLQLRIDTDDGEIVLPEGLVEAIEKRLERKLSLIDVSNFGNRNMYAYKVSIPSAKKQAVAPPLKSKTKPLPKNRERQPIVPPDSYFSTGKKDEYLINGIIYVDVSGKSLLWGQVQSFLAGLSGKQIVTSLDRLSGVWDRMKQDAVRGKRW